MGGGHKQVIKIESTIFQLQNKWVIGCEMYSLGDIVNNYVISLYSDTWWLDLWWSLWNV